MSFCSSTTRALTYELTRSQILSCLTTWRKKRSRCFKSSVPKSSPSDRYRSSTDLTTSTSLGDAPSSLGNGPSSRTRAAILHPIPLERRRPCRSPRAARTRPICSSLPTPRRRRDLPPRGRQLRHQHSRGPQAKPTEIRHEGCSPTSSRTCRTWSRTRKGLLSRFGSRRPGAWTGSSVVQGQEARSPASDDS